MIKKNNGNLSGGLVDKHSACDFPFKTATDEEYTDEQLVETANEELNERVENKKIGDNPKAFGFKK